MAIVRDDADREKRLDWLRRTVEIHGWRLHAFVLMTDHEHLLVETPKANLSAGMQYLGGSDTSYFNRRHQRSGHFFQGRFKGHLIEEKGYFLEVSRYIHLNPVRAKMVDRLEDYRWSSCAGYVRARRVVESVTYHRVSGKFSDDLTAAWHAYGRFVRLGVADPPARPFVNAVGGLLLGSEGFVDRIRALLRERGEDPGLPELRQLRPRPAMARIVSEVATHFGHDPDQWRPIWPGVDSGMHPGKLLPPWVTAAMEESPTP